MRIAEVRIQVFQHPVPPMWRGNLGERLDITLVTVATEDGVEGHAMGRAVGRAPGAVLALELAAVARPLLIGSDALDRELIWQRLWNLVGKIRLSTFALSCVDVALWDIAGKAAGLPVHKLIGSYRDRVPAYASSGRHPQVEAYVEEALACRERGFKAYKIHPFGKPEQDVEACRRVREAVGEKMALMLDPTGAYDHREALWVGRRLEDLHFHWYEEPVGEYQLTAYAELCRALDIPILAGELLPGTVFTAAELITRGATDLVRADVYWKGGITAVLKIAHLAEAFGKKLEVHHGASAIMNMANLQAICAFANGDFVEVLVPEGGLDYGLRAYPRVDEDGFLAVPRGPGLGAEIDWDYVNANTVMVA